MLVMGQARWAANSPLEALELPTPTPKPGEVRVAVRAIGVNPVDWKMRTRGPLKLAARLVGPPLPFVPGVDFAGVVDAVGPGDTGGLAVGDRVVGGTDFSRGQRGSYADAVIARPDQLHVLPPDVNFETAGALPVAGVTAQMAVVDIGRLDRVPTERRRVLVLGAAGGVGQLAVQIAKAHGAFVVGVCSGRNAARVQALGADAVVDYSDPQTGDPLVASRGRGPFQVVVDCVGTYSAGGCRSLLQPGGRHIMVSGESVGAFLNSLVPPFQSKLLLGRVTRARLAPLVALLREGRLRVEIAERMPLREAERAHALSQTGRTAGKIVLTV